MAHALIWNGNEFVTIPREEAIAQAESGAASVYDEILPGEWVVVKDGKRVKELLWPDGYAEAPKPKRKPKKKVVRRKKAESTTAETDADDEKDAAPDEN